MELKTLLTAVILTFAASASHAEGTCRQQELESLFVTYQDTAKIGDDINRLVEQHVGELIKVAKELDLRQFEILSRDVSASRGDADVVEVNLSVSMRFARDGRALTTVLNKTKGVAAIGSSIQTEEICPNK
ncbi:MAG: hypothetical protein AB1810_00280 [Pseudomonadota bacterium]